MARLPQPGGDYGNWGDILNDYLNQSHKTDGTIKDGSVTSDSIAPGAITSAKIATDAVGATQIADGSITNTLLADGTIAEVKLASAVQAKLNAGTTSPDWSTITGKPAIIAAGADQAAARSVIGAGVSNLALGTSSSTAKAGDYQPTVADISDATTTGRSVVKAADAAAARTAIGAGTSSLALGTTSTTAKAGDYQPTAANITDATAVGRNVLKASNQAAARLAIGIASGKSFFVDDYGSDPTGATASDSAVAAAIAALGNGPGIIEFGVGTYLLNSSQVLARAGQYFKGQGLGITTIDFRGTGPGLKCWDSTVATDGLSAPGHGGGVLGGLTITGQFNTNPNVIGLQIGDLLNPMAENVRIFGFTTAGSIGFLGQNRYSWSEYGDLNITSSYNTNCFVFESHPSHPLSNGGKSSWSYNTFDFGFSAEANQNGVILRNKVDLTGIHWTMSFNCNPGATNTGVAITIGINSTDDCHIDGFVSWFGESTTPGAVAHKDINVGANSGLRGYGALVFNDFSAAFLAGSAVPYRVVFAGRVNCPSLGHYAQVDIPFVTIGDPGRFGALGDSANYVNIEEGASGGWPLLQARGPSADIGINLISKGYGSIQANGAPVVTNAPVQPTAWNSPGVTGQIGFDSGFLYVCVSTNVWKRVTLSSF